MIDFYKWYFELGTRDYFIMFPIESHNEYLGMMASENVDELYVSYMFAPPEQWFHENYYSRAADFKKIAEVSPKTYEKSFRRTFKYIFDKNYERPD